MCSRAQQSHSLVFLISKVETGRYLVHAHGSLPALLWHGAPELDAGFVVVGRLCFMLSPPATHQSCCEL